MADIAPPEPRSLGDEIGSILQLSGALTQQQAQASVQTNAQLVAQNLAAVRKENWGLYEDIGDEVWALRGANIDWLRTMGPEAQQAYLAANPALARSLGYVDEMASASALGTPQMTALLNQQALQGLQLGGKLSPEEERFAQQSAREAYSARGMVMGDSAALAEVLNRDSLARQRLQQAQAFAGSREAGNRAFVTSAAQLADQTSGAKYVMGISDQIPLAANQLAAGIVSATPVPNFQGIAGAGVGYVSDLYNTNLNMQASMYNSQQNNAAALQAAQIQADAQIASARMQAQALSASANMQAGAASSAGSSAMTGSLIGAGGAVIGGALIAF